MTLQLRTEITRIRNGYAAQSPELRLAGHGWQPIVACGALAKAVSAFLRSLDRYSPQEYETAIAALVESGSVWVEDGRRHSVICDEPLPV